ncbi:unnamed protein product, partial [Nesidiocoris tenuis]
MGSHDKKEAEFANVDSLHVLQTAGSHSQAIADELPSTTLCLASLFYLPNVLPLSCETRIVNVNSPLWRQLKVGNSWVFCVPDDAEIKIKCPTIVDRTVLTGIGIFSINPACVGYTPLYTLIPRRSASAVINSSFIPNFNISF